MGSDEDPAQPQIKQFLKNHLKGESFKKEVVTENLAATPGWVGRLGRNTSLSSDPNHGSPAASSQNLCASICKAGGSDSHPRGCCDNRGRRKGPTE